MTEHWRTLSPQDLLERTGQWLGAQRGVVRVAVDGPSVADPHAFANSLIEPLHERGRPAVHVRADAFWHDASLRFERGREDWESYLSWLDADTLRREVLDAALQRGTYLPSLRDPESNRVTREPPCAVESRTVVLVSGEFLLGRGLPFDRAIHLETSAAERARLTAEELAWTLPAFEQYESAVRPAEQADVVVKAKRYLTVRGLP